jgi:hypothetical protein
MQNEINGHATNKKVCFVEFDFTNVLFQERRSSSLFRHVSGSKKELPAHFRDSFYKPTDPWDSDDDLLPRSPKREDLFKKK